MERKEVEVTFRTITPLWTGDAWQWQGNREGKREIRPSSLIGSLRFWFEIICYFNGVVDEESFDPKKGRFEKEINPNALREYIKKYGNTFECKIQALLEQDIPIPAIIFGTTGWRSLIEIKEVLEPEEYGVYPFPEGKIEIPELKHNGKVPSWYFGRGFYGRFQVKFLVEKSILEDIFYPLLNFMDKYGFWGGKWNIGYGRLKVVEVKKNGSKEDNWECETFQIYELKNNGKLNKKNVSKDMFLNENIKEFEELIQTSPKN